MNAVLRRLRQDALKRELAPLLSFDIDPSAIDDYGLPAYKSYQLRSGGRLLRRLRKIASYRLRRRLLQHRDYIRLGSFREHETYRFLEELWDAGLDYRRTARFRDFSRRIEEGGAVKLPSKRRLLATAADLDPYFQDYVRLLESMRDHGYLATGSRDRITIMIDRDGRIVKETKGRHRLSAARIVGAPSVPVRISHVHAGWVEAQASEGASGARLVDRVRTAVERTVAEVGARGVAARGREPLASDNGW